MRSFLVCFALTATLSAQPFTFTHFVGTPGGPGVTDGTGQGARFWDPYSAATDPAGNIYVTDGANHTIRKITPAGQVSTFAGLANEPGFANGARYAARFNKPTGIAVDASGNVYVNDSGNYVIRKITPAGVVTTLAGSPGISGYTDATGSNARFWLTVGLTCDNDGNVYVADYGYNTIRKITPAGAVTTLAGSPDASGSGSADGTGSAARFYRPVGVQADALDNVYVADWGNNTIRKITPAGVVTTIAGAAGPCAYVDGAAASSRFCAPRDLAIDAVGNLYVADVANFRVRKITLSSMTVSTFAGSGSFQYADGNGTAASFTNLHDITADGSSNLYVVELSSQTIRKITPSAEVTTFAGLNAATGLGTSSGTNGRFNGPNEAAYDNAGNLYIADTDNNTIRRVATGTNAAWIFAGDQDGGDADGTGAAARFRKPSGITTNGTDIYVADVFNHTIRKITAGGDVTTLAGTALFSGSTDGTGSAARFLEPHDVACDAAGNIYVADLGNHTIRKITPAGEVSTLAGLAGMIGSTNGTGSAARFYAPAALIVASDGNLYVADRANHVIRKVTMAGVVTTLAGSPGETGSQDGTGSAARFVYPNSIAADGSGNLYVADGLYTIRKITLGGVVTTIGGRYNIRGSEPGTGLLSRFANLQGIAVNGGVLTIVDNQTIRRGALAVGDAATIDVAEGSIGAVRQLGTSPNTASSWLWTIVRRPSGSTATLSASNIRNPTFTPDVPDLYRFRLVASNGTATSVTEVDLVAISATLTVGPATLPNGTRSLAYSANVSASGGTAPYTFAVIDGALPAGISLDPSGAFSGVPSSAGGFTFKVRATDSVGSVGDRTYTLTIVSAPNGVEAEAASASSVVVEWNPLAMATGYRVYRSASGTTSFTFIGEAASTTFTDLGAGPNTAYLYRVTGIDGAAHETLPSAFDLATTVMFSDSPLDIGVTKILDTHILQLRTAVNAVRALALLGSESFTDATLDGETIKAVHITELRTAIAGARTALSLAALSWTDPTITPEMTKAKAAHVEELREGVR